MRILVTGASGFVGSHLARALRARGEVVALRGDLRDAKSFGDLPRVDLAYHLAARSSPAGSTADPVGTWDVNAQGTMNLLEWARRTDLPRLVLVSTAHVYGRATYSPIDERHPLHPVSPYGGSKLAAEAMALAYHGSYGLGTTIVRPFNMYGAGQGPGFLIPDVLLQIREGARLVLGDPSPVRDFTHVDDAADFLDKAGALDAAVGKTLNLGTGEGHSVAEVVETALRVSGSTLRPFYDPARFRKVDVPELVVDNRLAASVLGWRPRVGLEEGLRRTWEAMAAPDAGKNV